jgi:hypothetical protein
MGDEAKHAWKNCGAASGYAAVADEEDAGAAGAGAAAGAGGAAGELDAPLVPLVPPEVEVELAASESFFAPAL